MAERRNFGLWDSPITAESLAKAGLSIESNFAIRDGKIYFVERRPEQKNEVLVALSLLDMTCEDVTLSDMTLSGMTLAEHGVRSTVHEYGGLAWCLSDTGVAFVEAKSQHIIFYDGHEYRTLFGIDGGRFGDLHYDKHGGRYLAVGEFHGGGKGGEVRNELWSISMTGEGSYCLQSGADFYAAPCVSADGKRCAWLQWNHPLMAWDGAELWQADIGEDGRLCNHQHIRGGVDGEKRESCFQPQYSGEGGGEGDSAGNLYFICDNADGFWQLHCLDAGGEVRDFPLRGEEGWVECGLPLWQLGMRTYDFTGDGGILLAGCDRGIWHLYLLRGGEGGEGGEGWQRLNVDYCSYDGLRCSGGRGYFLGSRVEGAPVLVELDIGSGSCRELRKCGGGDYGVGYISRGESFTFESSGVMVQGYFYAPANVDYEGEGKPPLIMRCHGGPTAGVHNGFAGKIQYWTSRGFAVCDLNYRGSTGFGRGFREALYGGWGVVEVDDYVSAANYLAGEGGEGLVDGERLIISGSSAGGFTVLSVLAFRDIFSVGCSAYGIGDLLMLASDTHKFESHYLESLVGEAREAGESLYRERSPYYSAGGIDCPVLFLQGSDDMVVPVNQMRSMVEVLEGGGVWCEYILFEGEGHGFRDGDNIVRAFEGELDFYVRVLKLEA